MATKQKQGKSGKENEKRSAKRAEDNISVEDKKTDSPSVSENAVPDAVEEQPSELKSPTPKPPTPEPVYDEPVLTQLIVESYDGEKVKGLYEGEGEASFTGNHHYKGEFLEGLMHGHGIYTWSDNVSYEGEFTKNSVTGKGIYRWPDGSNYDGDVANGLRHGFGTFRCANNRLSYTGEWSLGKRHGKGRMEYDAEGNSFYEGDWVNNVRHGFGTRGYPSGNLYQGMWVNNIRHGEGTMRWVDRDQMYTGQWENGIQYGHGQHIWLLRRVAGSQYPLRNTYDGEFIQGRRSGFGTFYYANGARYEGEWADNLKHGKGKFVFKNGRIYEGVFERDHIVEFPEFQMDGVTTPDLSMIRTRTPLPTDQLSVRSNDSHNTYSPSFQLDVGHLLEEFPESDRDEEATQVLFVLMRHMSSLRKIYTFYSLLGFQGTRNHDNTFIMNRLQWWRFLKDCHFHHQDMTLTQMDRALALDKTVHGVEAMHDPYGKILFREFTNYLVTLAFRINYKDEGDQMPTAPILASCLSKLITENILPYACNVKGYIYTEDRRAENALVHVDQAYEVYRAFSTPAKMAPHEPVIKMRQFLFMLKDLRLVSHSLSAKNIIEVLSVDDPKVTDCDGSINMELEMTFLEFIEALTGCAETYVTEAVMKDPSTPRPSTTLTQEPSMSIMGSPSRVSQIEDGGEGGSALELGSRSEGGSVAPARTTSQMTAKSGTGSEKNNVEAQMSIQSIAEKDGSLAVSHHRLDSGKKSDVAGVDAKKSASFLSSQSVATEGQLPFLQSVVSMASEAGLEDQSDDDSEEEEELDEATRQFNFWTHQIHIFFVRKFFPAAQKFTLLKQLVAERLANQPPTPEPVLPEDDQPEDMITVETPEDSQILEDAESEAATKKEETIKTEDELTASKSLSGTSAHSSRRGTGASKGRSKKH